MSIEAIQASERTRLIRSATGSRVHRWGCPYAGKKWVPWSWAEGRPDTDWLSLPWLKTCRHCIGKLG